MHKPHQPKTITSCITAMSYDCVFKIQFQTGLLKSIFGFEIYLPNSVISDFTDLTVSGHLGFYL